MSTCSRASLRFLHRFLDLWACADGLPAVLLTSEYAVAAFVTEGLNASILNVCLDALKERVKEHTRRLVSGTSAFSASKAHQRGLANPACLRREPLDPSIARRNAPVLPSAAHDFRDRMRLLSNAASVVDAGVWQPLFCMVDKDRAEINALIVFSRMGAHPSVTHNHPLRRTQTFIQEDTSEQGAFENSQNLLMCRVTVKVHFAGILCEVNHPEVTSRLPQGHNVRPRSNWPMQRRLIERPLKRKVRRGPVCCAPQPVFFWPAPSKKVGSPAPLANPCISPACHEPASFDASCPTGLKVASFCMMLPHL
jgi:hypothetical protein